MVAFYLLCTNLFSYRHDCQIIAKKKILTKIKKDLTLLYNVEDNFFYTIS